MYAKINAKDVLELIYADTIWKYLIDTMNEKDIIENVLYDIGAEKILEAIDLDIIKDYIDGVECSE